MTQCRRLASLPSLTPTSLNRLQMFCCCSNSWIAASCSLWASVSLGLFSSRPARKTTIKKKQNNTARKACFKTFLLSSCSVLTVGAAVKLTEEARQSPFLRHRLTRSTQRHFTLTVRSQNAFTEPSLSNSGQNKSS